MFHKAARAGQSCLDTIAEYCASSAVDLKIVRHVSLCSVGIDFHIDRASAVIYIDDQLS